MTVKHKRRLTFWITNRKITVRILTRINFINKSEKLQLTCVGKNLLVRMPFKVIEIVKVPKNRITDKKKTSGSVSSWQSYNLSQCPPVSTQSSRVLLAQKAVMLISGVVISVTLTVVVGSVELLTAAEVALVILVAVLSLTNGGRHIPWHQPGRVSMGKCMGWLNVTLASLAKASLIKIKEISSAKLSSVKRVMYWTHADRSRTTMTINRIPVHKPIHRRNSR